MESPFVGIKSRMLKVGDVMVTGETVVTIADNSYLAKNKLIVVLSRPDRPRNRMAVWNKYGTLTIKRRVKNDAK